MIGYKNLKEIITLQKVHEKDGRGLITEDLSIIEDGAIVFNEGKILWVGQASDTPSEYKELAWEDKSQFILSPEIVDPHTHLVFAGDRSDEFVARLRGADYEEIGRMGGGILSTRKSTMAAGIEELYEASIKRIKKIHSYGVGTIEIKSGYALDRKKEEEVTRLIDRLKKECAPKVQIFNTFMPAHAIPPEYSNGKDYIKEVCIPLMKELAPSEIIDAVDIFHEEGHFGTEETKLLFEEAKKLGLAVKMHADEFNDNGGAELACKFDSLSADHLLKVGPTGIDTLKKSNTVATLLPGTAFFLGKPQAPARKLLDGGAKVAIASDYNPGSSHWDNLPQIARIAAPTYKMNLGELWSAITYNSAHALGKRNQGALIPGMDARFTLLNSPSLSHWVYNW